MGLYVEILRHMSILLRRTFITVDIIIRRSDNSVVLVKRAFEPYKGEWALPGGFLKFGGTVEDTAVREAKEETGLDIKVERVARIASDPSRDPRGHIISVVLLAKEVGGELRAGSDAVEVKSFKQVPDRLAFDHYETLRSTEFTGNPVL